MFSRAEPACMLLPVTPLALQVQNQVVDKATETLKFLGKVLRHLLLLFMGAIFLSHTCIIPVFVVFCMRTCLSCVSMSQCWNRPLLALAKTTVPAFSTVIQNKRFLTCCTFKEPVSKDPTVKVGVSFCRALFNLLHNACPRSPMLCLLCLHTPFSLLMPFRRTQPESSLLIPAMSKVHYLYTVL